MPDSGIRLFRSGMRLSNFRRVFLLLLHQVMQGEGHFVRVSHGPGDDTLELDEIVGDCADFHQLGFDYLRIAHGCFSMAHPGICGYGEAG